MRRGARDNLLFAVSSSYLTILRGKAVVVEATVETRLVLSAPVRINFEGRRGMGTRTRVGRLGSVVNEVNRIWVS